MTTQTEATDLVASVILVCLNRFGRALPLDNVPVTGHVVPDLLPTVEFLFGLQSFSNLEHVTTPDDAIDSNLVIDNAASHADAEDLR